MPQVLAMCPEGEEAGCILVLRACACAMAKQAQGDQTSVMTALKVRLAGADGGGAAPTITNRTSAAERLCAAASPTMLALACHCLPQVLKELRVFGIHDMLVPPVKDLLYRCTLVRELFTQPCLLGTALQCLKGECRKRMRHGQQGL